MKPGDIAIASLQQSDGQHKLRPVLILKKMPIHDDLLVCGISSQLWNYAKGFDEKLDELHPDYAGSGLKRSGIIRLGYLATLDIGDIKGSIGQVSSETYRQLISRLVAYLESNANNHGAAV